MRILLKSNQRDSLHLRSINQEFQYSEFISIKPKLWFIAKKNVPTENSELQIALWLRHQRTKNEWYRIL